MDPESKQIRKAAKVIGMNLCVEPLSSPRFLEKGKWRGEMIGRAAKNAGHGPEVPSAAVCAALEG